MHTTKNHQGDHFVIHLRCPRCKRELISIEGSLHCAVHGNFQMADGIPSFVPNDLFDGHWVANELAEISESKRTVGTEFLKPLISSINSQESNSVLDVGCGDGVHLHILDEIFGGSGRVNLWGLDISFEALRIARYRVKNKVEFVHADAGALPFEDEKFDAAFSFGVLAYTNNPEFSFSELVRTVRKDGVVGVWFYPAKRGLGGAIFRMLRAICRVSGEGSTRLIANCIVPFLGILPTRSKVNILNSSWSQCREVVLVNIAPPKLFFPVEGEIEGWFAKYGVKVIYVDYKNPVTVWGTKLTSDR